MPLTGDCKAVNDSAYDFSDAAILVAKSNGTRLRGMELNRDSSPLEDMRV